MKFNQYRFCVIKTVGIGTGTTSFMCTPFCNKENCNKNLIEETIYEMDEFCFALISYLVHRFKTLPILPPKKKEEKVYRDGEELTATKTCSFYDADHIEFSYNLTELGREAVKFIVERDTLTPGSPYNVHEDEKIDAFKYWIDDGGHTHFNMREFGEWAKIFDQSLLRLILHRLIDLEIITIRVHPKKREKA